MKFSAFLFVLFICFMPNASMSNEKQKIASCIDVILKTDLKYIDKVTDAEKLKFSIPFEVYIVNKTKKDLKIPYLRNGLTFYVYYNSTSKYSVVPLSLGPNIYFGSSDEKVLLKAGSYIKMEFKYSISEYDFNRYIIPHNYNLFQAWCEWEKIKKSNTVNIPIISLDAHPPRISDKNSSSENEDGNLEDLAEKLGVTVEDLLKDNPALREKNKSKQSQEECIEEEVLPNETLEEIADRYGIKVDDLRKVNPALKKCKANQPLKPFSTIRIPKQKSKE